MKSFFRSFFLFSLLVSVSFVNAQSEVHFDESGYQSVLQRAKKEHKPVFFMIYATWCSHCNKMKAEVFKDAVVADFMNQNFICAWQDIEKGEGDFFKNKYKIRAFPNFLFFDENGKLLYQFNGEYQSAEFLTEVKNGMVPEKQLPYLEQQFYADPTNGKKCLDFLTTMKKGSERSELNRHAQKYLATQTDAQLVSETNWRIIANGVSDIESHPFQYVLQHQTEFAGVASPKRVQKKLENIVTELLNPYPESTDTVNYFKQRKIAQTVHTTKTDSIIFRYDLFIAEKTKNWKWYAKSTAANAETYLWKDASMLREIGRNYQKNISDSADLQLGIRIAERSEELSDSYDTSIVLAKLYQKVNDPKMARNYAEKAKKKNGDLGFNTSEADELLRQLGNK